MNSCLYGIDMQRATFPMRKRTWVPAALFLMAFYLLRIVSLSFGNLFEGLGIVLPLRMRLVIAYGPIAFPVVGLLTAISLILSERFVRRSALCGRMITFCMLIVVWALIAVYFGSIFMSPVIQTKFSHRITKSVPTRGKNLRKGLAQSCGCV